MEYQFSYLCRAKVAWSNLFGPWMMGAAMFIQDAHGKFNAIETLERLNKYPITTLCTPPTAYRMMVLDEPMAYMKDSQGGVEGDGAGKETGEIGK